MSKIANDGLTRSGKDASYLYRGNSGRQRVKSPKVGTLLCNVYDVKTQWSRL